MPATPIPTVTTPPGESESGVVLESVLRLEVGQVAAGGACVARAPDGRVVLVRHSLPGEIVQAVVTEEHTSYLRADAIEIIEAAPERVDPPCPHSGPGRCGGCDFQHVALLAQRALKEAIVEEQLRRIAGISLAVEVEAVIAPHLDPERHEARQASEVAGPRSPESVARNDGLAWRTRVRFAVDESGRVGLHRHRSGEIELVDRCAIAVGGIDRLALSTHDWSGASSIEAFASPVDDQAVVSIEPAAPASRRAHRGDAGLGAGLPADLGAGFVTGHKVLRAPGGIRLEVQGRAFDVSAGSFWQVHPDAPSLLAEAVLSGLSPEPGDRVVDLYAGVGLFSALIAEAVGPTGSVLAVERDAGACADAAFNLSDLAQATVRRASVSARLVATEIGTPDLVVLDPSREGAGAKVAAALGALTPPPRTIVYVSCDAATFARDLKVLLESGYEIAQLRALDLFPMTAHVELVATLTYGRVTAGS